MSTGDPFCSNCESWFCFGSCFVTEQSDNAFYGKIGNMIRSKTKMEKFDLSDERPALRGVHATSNDLREYLTAYLGDAVFARRFADCIDLIKGKNADYTEGDQDRDRISHFRETAEDLDLPMIKIWSVFTRKHWSAIQKFVKSGQTESEPIDGRINDVINYCVLLGAIIDDGKCE